MAKLGELISTCNGRLTLTSGTPVTTSDVTAATSVYFCPYKGNNIALYNVDFEEWRFYNFSEISYSLAGKTADTNYDLFIYDNAGTLTLELVAWSDATTRATALAVQDGIYVLTGSLNKRYLGTIRTTSTIGQCEDSETTRYCWNFYNRISRLLRLQDGTVHSYTVATWRSWNNDTSLRVEFVSGNADQAIPIEIEGELRSSAIGNLQTVGYGLSSTTVTRLRVGNANTGDIRVTSSRTETPRLGYYYIQALEYSGSGTLYADNIIILCSIDG